MKKLLSFLLAWLLTAMIPPAASAAEETVPMRYTPVKPVHDGVIAAAEWGEADHILEPDDPTKPEKIEYWFRWSSTALHVAVRVHTGNFKAGLVEDGASYLIPRIQMAEGENVTYMGVISITDDTGEVYIPHLNKISVGTCAVRAGVGTVDVEVAFPLYISYTGDDTDYLVLQLDYHEPREIKTSCKVLLTYSDEPVSLPAPPETEAPETYPPESMPADTAPAESVPVGTDVPQDTDPADGPSALPAVIGCAAAIAVIGALCTVLLKKKKK